MRSAKHNWNADDYAKNSSAQLEWAQELIAKLALQGHESVLDIGCGDGKVSAQLARKRSFHQRPTPTCCSALWTQHKFTFPKDSTSRFQTLRFIGWKTTELSFAACILVVNPAAHPPDDRGNTHVKMVRLEVEACAV